MAHLKTSIPVFCTVVDWAGSAVAPQPGSAPTPRGYCALPACRSFPFVSMRYQTVSILQWFDLEEEGCTIYPLSGRLLHQNLHNLRSQPCDFHRFPGPNHCRGRWLVGGEKVDHGGRLLCWPIRLPFQADHAALSRRFWMDLPWPQYLQPRASFHGYSLLHLTIVDKSQY